MNLLRRLGLQSFEGLTRARRSFQMAPDIANGRRLQFLSGYWQEGSLSCHMGLSIGLLKTSPLMAAGFLQGEGSEREQGGHNAFYDLVSEVTNHHFCHILLGGSK